MDLIDFARYVGALLLVLGLVGAAGIGARRFGLGSLVKPIASRRLTIIESLAIAPRQRLLIIRRDGVEHLVLSGPEGASIIETGFAAVALPLADAPLTRETMS